LENTENKVNIRARIDRHLRIVRQTWWLNNNLINNKRISYSAKLVFIFVILVFPIYPFLSSIYSNSDHDFYRDYIDESSIIESYYWWDLPDQVDYWRLIIESEDTFLSVNTILNDNRDLAWTNEIISYEIKPWESFSSIAHNFNISLDSILRANNFDTTHILKPWEIIKVPPISWVLYQVVSWDTISSIAKKYDIWESVIKTQNSIDDWNVIKIWQILVIPWAVPIKPVNTTPTKIGTSSPSYTSSSSQNSGWYNFVNYANSTMTNERWSYQLVRRQPQWKFSRWNCTRYVAQYKNVSWWGNANEWMKSAAQKWIPTWKTPQVWAIIQFSGTGYNPRYGHVGIVMEVNSDHLIISDMNYRRLNEITYRKVPINDRSIVGYIYVD
jgi:surface antigen